MAEVHIYSHEAAPEFQLSGVSLYTVPISASVNRNHVYCPDDAQPGLCQFHQVMMLLWSSAGAARLATDFKYSMSGGLKLG
jgi:hypothetical protein